jgi:hypothetical protein
VSATQGSQEDTPPPKLIDPLRIPPMVFLPLAPEGPAMPPLALMGIEPLLVKPPGNPGIMTPP